MSDIFEKLPPQLAFLESSERVRALDDSVNRAQDDVVQAASDLAVAGAQFTEDLTLQAARAFFVGVRGFSIASGNCDARRADLMTECVAEIDREITRQVEAASIADDGNETAAEASSPSLALVAD